MTDYFSETSLAKAPPIKRAAYSDRTAWIMAEISRLVYEPLPGEISVKSMADEIKTAVEKGDTKDVIEALLSRAIQQGVSDTSPIADTLSKANFELLEAFSKNGTEAILARLNPDDASDGMLVLAFRGTQPSVKDIMSDIKADLVSAPGGGRIHRGFLDAFNEVKEAILAALNKHKGPPVYITGHSLGGALAIVATRYLSSDSTGSTYTFGGPRVADDRFFESIKTPVYRIVNAADGVPRVPFGYGLAIFLTLIRLLPINGTRPISEWIRKKFGGYTHYGNLVFLSAPPNIPDEEGIPFKGLVIKKSPNMFWRVKLVLIRLVATRGKAAMSDHRMYEYSQKLLAYARRRNRK